jgi:hypothetical protein
VVDEMKEIDGYLEDIPEMDLILSDVSKENVGGSV